MTKIFTPILLFAFLILAALEANAYQGKQTYVSAVRDDNSLDPVIEELLFDLQNNVDDVLRDTTNSLIFAGRCLVNENECSDLTLTNLESGASFDLPDNQKDLYEFIRFVYGQYRAYVGHKEFNRLKQFGFLEARINGIPGGEALHFSARYESGRNEYSSLREQQSDFAEILANLGAGKSGREFYQTKQLLLKQRRQFYEVMIGEYVKKFPFLLKMGKIEPTNEDIIQAFQATIDEYQQAREHVLSLQGKRKMELLGFTPILDKTLNQWTDEKASLALVKIQELQDRYNIWHKLGQIFLNWKTILTVGCFVVSYSHIALRWVGLFCTGFGLSNAVPALYESGMDMKRYFDYLQTGAFDSSVYNQQVLLFTAQMAMAGLYLSGAVPGFFQAANSLKSNLVVASQNYRTLGNSIGIQNGRVTFSDTFKKEVETLMVKYVKYYGKDIGSHEIATGGQFSRSTLHQILKAFGEGTQRAFARSPNIITYADLLKSSPMLAR